MLVYVRVNPFAFLKRTHSCASTENAHQKRPIRPHITPTLQLAKQLNRLVEILIPHVKRARPVVIRWEWICLSWSMVEHLCERER
ncbi:hypothetical protein RHMOL_Rhmol01G0002600 [Rhododendron molle]|uniref:Uncharacterized protein n=1 Tax=Rhododendron molle TaxID=49168 RepID=A0ACC0PZ39_RHOML|nr:hypothetical protein RHMOL_Rhmol01G0002600 [Rhododendron molle]